MLQVLKVSKQAAVIVLIATSPLIFVTDLKALTIALMATKQGHMGPSL